MALASTLIASQAAVYGSPAAGEGGDLRPGQEESQKPGRPSRGAAVQSPYVLQPGDEVEIKAFEIPELQDKVAIRPDGKISLLLVDEIEAAGLTATQLDQILTTEYSRFYQDPEITVIVRSFVNQQVFVGGEVHAPGIVLIRGKLTLTGAVFEAGGFRDTGKMKNVVLLRDAGENAIAFYRINVKEILKKGAPDIPLEPSDIVFVPKTTIAKADQFVSQYIRQLLPVQTNASFTYIMGERDVNVAP
jgi:protein involved in polysaccharide export with SLBB domain